MPELPDGIEAMRERMARASRKPPPPRRAAPAAPALPSEPDVPAAPNAPSSRPGVSGRSRDTAPARASRARREPIRLAPDLPPVNLAIRVRKPLDDHLADLIHELRGAGVRTSKVELIEMLLWELPAGVDATEQVLERLRGFRTWAPRGAGVMPDRPRSH